MRCHRVCVNAPPHRTRKHRLRTSHLTFSHLGPDLGLSWICLDGHRMIPVGPREVLRFTQLSRSAPFLPLLPVRAGLTSARAGQRQGEPLCIYPFFCGARSAGWFQRLGFLPLAPFSFFLSYLVVEIHEEPGGWASRTPRFARWDGGVSDMSLYC